MAASRLVWPGSWAKLLYTQNPFYLISACLVLYGMHVSFTSAADPVQAWTMMAIYGVYAVLLAMTAFIIVRFGQVWDDARMILLIIVLLFVALSNSLDAVVINNFSQGTTHLVIGLAFAVGLTELILWGLRMRLPWRYRVPFYLQLCLLFLYPTWLARLLETERKDLMAAFVLLFPVAVAGSLLALWPAAHKGSRGERPSGTPWRWPLYPWTLFFFTTLGLTLRAYSLSFSFEVGGGLESGFQGYFLIPILLSALVIVLEMGILTRSRITQCLAMLAPAGLIALALPGPPGNELQQRFLSMTLEAVGSPIQITIACLIAYYGIAVVRAVRFAEIGLVASVLLSTVAGSETVDLQTLSTPQTTPAVIAFSYLLALGVVERNSWRLLVAGGLVVAAMVIVLNGILPESQLSLHAFHLTYALLLTLGVTMNDSLARFVRKWNPVANVALAAAVVAVYPYTFAWITDTEQLAVLLVLAMFTLAFWFLHKDIAQFFAGTAILCLLVIGLFVNTYTIAREAAFIKGLNYLAWGVITLAMALLISLFKGGLVEQSRALLARLSELRGESQ